MKDAANHYWRRGSYRVDADGIYTPRTTIATEHVDLVDLRKPVLVETIAGAVIAGALTWRFYDVLTTTEVAILNGGALLGLVAGASIARLRLQSFSIRDASIFLPIWVAKPMRAAIEEVLRTRVRKGIKTERKAHDV